MSERLKLPLDIGIIGCGRMGAIRAEAVNVSGARVRWFFDTDEARGKCLAERHDATYCRCLTDNCWDKLDAVFICSKLACTCFWRSR
jgi:predicted dehydrogenase